MPWWKVLKQIVRATIAVAIVTVTTMVATLVRNDWVGAVAGVCIGLVLGVGLVYADWPAPSQ
jgi:hypothetical protein